MATGRHNHENYPGIKSPSLLPIDFKKSVIISRSVLRTTPGGSVVRPTLEESWWHQMSRPSSPDPIHTINLTIE